MKPLSLCSALVGLMVAGATATVEAVATRSIASLPATFTPPAVFKHKNLVRIVSLEKNYARETINVQVANVDKHAQSEYFLAFDAVKFPHVGGVEVKDKKDPEAGEFIVTPVEYDAANPVQYYKITFPTALAADAQQTLSITYNILKASKPLPASIAQQDRQFLKYDFSAYVPSAYETAKQKTEIKFSTSKVPDYTKIEGLTQLQNTKLTYGPFENQPAGAAYPASVRYEFNKPVIHIQTLDRDVEVSHWGGNVAFEEHYDLYHRGANLSSLFSRVKWQQQMYMNPETHAVKELTFNLPVGSVDPYYTDVIGNVSTSRFRANHREALLQAKPRYPIFGGWKYPFTVGWNSDTDYFVRSTGGNGYVLNVPLFDGPTQAEGVEYGTVNVQVLLPEGAENVRYYADIPSSSIVKSEVTIVKTYLDTVGRTAVIVKAENLVDDMGSRQLVIAYNYSTAAALRKPLVVFASALSLFFAAFVVTSIDLSFAKTSKKN
ncbi:hypothetical protein TD95_000569 [Thielaviopsis punctulata]|uniref:Dolichyl-diphosphooligosaccharide--protein glycosyltransferase subunit 1 n=1 Tax=Thielaviopsis punctulata TaxID=72032 RepID=A0A0F4ZLK6_9PEZI|nr:hypothetical protein TD95_000569 [Thielaviopsis punctulata]